MYTIQCIVNTTQSKKASGYEMKISLHWEPSCNSVNLAPKMHATSGRRILVFGNRTFNNISSKIFALPRQIALGFQIWDSTNTICTRPSVQSKFISGTATTVRQQLEVEQSQTYPPGEIENTFSPKHNKLTSPTNVDGWRRSEQEKITAKHAVREENTEANLRK